MQEQQHVKGMCALKNIAAVGTCFFKNDDKADVTSAGPKHFFKMQRDPIMAPPCFEKF